MNKYRQEEIQDKRASSRSFFSVPVCLRKADGSRSYTTCLNISKGGIFIIDENPPQAGEICSVELTELQGDEILQGDMEVLWTQPSSVSQDAGFGAKFIHVDVKGQQAIYSLLNTVLHREHLLNQIKELKNKQLLAKDIAEIQGIELGTELKKFINGYSRVGERASFLWNWVYQGLKLTALNTIDSSLWEEVQEIKWLGVMFDVLLDDAVDEKQNLTLTNQLLYIAYEPDLVDSGLLSGQDSDYVSFSKKVWEQIDTRTQALPRYQEFKHLLEFDYRQLLNCMRYALSVNQNPQQLNLVEHDLYQPHNMHMMISATIDLMASPRFDMAEIGLLREVIWQGQVMGRIGNAVTTWQRELKVGDLSSGIFALALSRGILSPQDIVKEDTSKIEARLLKSGLEDELLIKWAESHARIAEFVPRIKSVEVEKFLTGLEHLIRIHLGSRGLK